MKHPVKKIENIPWDIGPKFDNKFTPSKPENMPIKRLECHTLPPIEIYRVVMEAQAMDIKIPLSVQEWMARETSLDG